MRLERGKEWWIARARRESGAAAAAGARTFTEEWKWGTGAGGKMTDIVERLRATLIPELYVEAADEIERLRSMRECTEEQCPYEAQRAEIERLRAALQRIVDEAESDDGLTAWDGGDIAREALGK